ncbi:MULTISPECIES: alpha-keto acid decarboxylase family protein [Providencia]|uniref:Alpha-keto acid decarboxylase family protein n=1 Tax=Providencia rettgeri TaxID=587 RepID=A0AAD2ZPH8_PRORE|nr:thiamine pyrophosphate-binding protein [Providencia rettgeri]ELR5075697.1 alpha-keto acid decarboxylase family protein [Providencia stuartii]ELR5071457.1 alpha-keto acid decarboxylase family protein [Providencia rettgeri]ELR5219515.1 alpha-keto acid decarboxylase family protein [Providencia rettgeri]ELR5223393.1 alpha-keto acid decarboxylase family protein [Providencia rettgeri]MDX7323629.1 thiamine pyrophosphate-binding protein [Providencia rettgeri]
MNETVIEYILSKLYDLGIEDIFGVPGDYSFPINDTVCTTPYLRWVGNCNELNAAYAADGYARIKGMAALSTTFGVGELSALNAIAGSFAERLPIFHLVGMPPSQSQQNQRIAHHTLGNGNYDAFYKMSQHIVCAHAIITPENCIEETERLIICALHERRPVYFGLPADYAMQPIIKQTNTSLSFAPKSCLKTLKTTVNLIINKLINSKQACLLAGSISLRLGLEKNLQDLIEHTQIPYTTLFMDKSVLDETNTQYMGMYAGDFINPQVTSFVESCDCILNFGTIMSDFNTACYTSNIKAENIIHIMDNYVIIDDQCYNNIYMKDILLALKNNLISPTHYPFSQNSFPRAQSLGEPIVSATKEITETFLYPRLEKMLKPNDMIFGDIGTFTMGLAFALLPKGASFQTQSLWGSIGWATPAALGAALASPSRRIILITGEGAHQLTMQEISQFSRFGLKPIIFVLNNDGYLIERLFCREPEYYYNDVAKWNYAQLPSALGCDDWYCKKVTTCEELNDTLLHIETLETAAYIEIITDRYDASKYLVKMGEAITSIY